MRKATILAVILLLASTLAQPAYGEIPRHLDPATLPQENPDPDKLFDLYYNIFHETAIENFTGSNIWLGWASSVEALPNLNPTLETYYNATDSELQLVTEIRSQIDEIQIMLMRQDPDTPGAVNNALAMLGKASDTLDDIDSQSKTLGVILNYPTTRLDEGVEELRQLLRSHLDELQHYENEITKELVANRPFINITSDKSEVMPGEVLLILGSLRDWNSTGLPNRSITIYFNDERITTTVTTETGELKADFTIPYVYEENATIYAEYLPEGSDTAVYSRAVSNIIIIKLNWIQPTLNIELPEEAYPGTELTISGLLSSEGVGLIGVEVVVNALGESVADKTSRKGIFTVTIRVPEDYPEGTEQVAVESHSGGLIGASFANGSVLIMRYPSTLTVDSPGWILSGQRLAVDGRVESRSLQMLGTLIEVRCSSGKGLTNVNADGTFRAEVDLPQTLLTSTYTFQVTSYPDPWIRGASATGSVLVVNPLTLLLILGFVGLITYQASKRINLRPRPRKRATPTPHLEERPPKPSLSQATVEAPDPENPRDLFKWLVSGIATRFNVPIGSTMTIREWLKTIKGEVDDSLYSLAERAGLLYEKTLYGKSTAKEGETKSLYQKLRELLR